LEAIGYVPAARGDVRLEGWEKETVIRVAIANPEQDQRLGGPG
jgi:hypothetical protein